MLARRPIRSSVSGMQPSPAHCVCPDAPIMQSCECPDKKYENTYDVYVDPSVGRRPPSIGDMTLWLEARRTGSAQADLSRMSSWVDLSTRNHSLVEGTAGNQPLWNNNNGKPFVDFDDSNRKMNRAGFGAEAISSYVGLNEGTIIFTINHYDNTQPTTIFSWNAAALDRFVSHCSYSDDLVYVDWGDRTSGGRVTFSEPGGWHTGWHTVEYNRNGNAFKAIIDGASVYDNASAYSDALTESSQVFGIGNVAGFGWRLSALLMWNRSLSDAEMQLAREYVNEFRP